MTTLTLWDSIADPPELGDLIYRWDGHEETASVRSLLRYVEARGDQLRRRYAAWIHDLGESRINGDRLVNHLAFDDGLSYWWMTLLVEQSVWKSPCIVDAIRLLAIEEIILDEKPDKLRLVSGNRRVHRVLRGLCQKKLIAYEWEPPQVKPRRRFNARGIYQAVPPSIRAIISLARYLRARWPFSQSDEPNWFDGRQALFVCSYFDNLDPEAAAAGRFSSYYWTGLPALLKRMGHEGNWLQLFVPCSVVPNASSALGYVRRFNEQRQQQGSHSFLDRHLSWRLVMRVVRRWLGLNLASRRLGGIKRAFRPQGSQLSLWPLMRRDWLASMRGPVAISNLLSVELFDAALRHLPHQSKGLYLCENQTWERALIHAWRKHGHGQLIAVPHSTRSFWDLRFFYDPRTVRAQSDHPLPEPDLTAVNGKPALDAFLRGNYRKEAIIECEALRYGYLRDFRAGGVSEASGAGPLKVLVLGDYRPSSTNKMLRLLEAALPETSNRVAYTVKPHPNCPIRAADYPSLRLRVVVDPLAQLLPDFHVAYSSNMTSAAADAYVAGLPVVVRLDESELNFSPLRDQPGVLFVSKPEELAEALRTAPYHGVHRRDRDDFFFLDPKMPRWSRLLAN